METIRIVATGVGIFIGALLATPILVFGYSPETTHKGLTMDTIRYYEAVYGEEFGDNEEELIAQGSIDEDRPVFVRPFFHFYDPVYNRGVLGNMTSKDWAEDTKTQARFSPTYLASTGSLAKSLYRSNTDYSWDRAVYEYVHGDKERALKTLYEYVHGDKERALKTLGHILHLTQDAAVPAHTRNDPHPPALDLGSPYEHWTGEEFNAENIRMSEELLREGERPIEMNSLGGYFDTLAQFSNNNFFSKDTIFDNDYTKPEINFERNVGSRRLGFGSLNGGTYKLVGIDVERNSLTDEETKSFHLNADEDEDILTDYWNLLSREAVQHGAGVIHLFFERVAEEKETQALYYKNKSALAKTFDKTQAALFGLAKNLYGSSIDEETFNELNPDAARTQQEASVVSVADDTEQEEGPSSQSEETQEEPEQENEQGAETHNEGDEGERTGETDEGDEGGGTSSPPDPFSQDIPFQGVGGGGSAPPQDNTQESEQDNGNTQENEEDEEDETQQSTSTTTPPTSATTTPDTTPPSAPLITAPAESGQTFTHTDITFAGTAEASSTISTDFSAATTTAMPVATSTGTWSLSLSGFPQGTSTLAFFATDVAGNTSPAATTSVFIDTEAPDVSLSIDQCDDSLVSGGCLLATTTLSISWQASDDEPSHFTIDNNGAFSTTTATSTTATAPSSGEFTFAVSARDAFGNTSATTTKTISVHNAPVVINEIAWMGTGASSADEWIELYNPTEHDIALDTFILHAEDGVPHIPLSGTIGAGEYYLIERTDDDTIADIPADLAVPFSGTTDGSGLSNDGERLLLSHLSGGATTTIDEVADCPKWCDGSTHQDKTMERFRADRSGTDHRNWGTASTRIRNGVTADGTPINGTPGRRNLTTLLLNKNEDITEDLTLTKQNSPYLVNDTEIEIDSGATLTIEPGVVVKLHGDAGIRAKGTIDAHGTPAEPIVFTSFLDDEHGGDTNRDGVCDPDDASSTSACPWRGSWEQIILQEGSGSSVFENVVMRYGGESGGGGRDEAMFVVEHASPEIAQSTFEYARTHGVALVHASSTITESTFRGNDDDNGVAGLHIEHGAPEVEDNTFTENEIGLRVSNMSGVVRDNTFTDNATRAMLSLGSARAEISGNSGSGNGVNGIVMYGTIAREGEDITLNANDAFPYVFDTSRLETKASSTLSIEPGAVLKFDEKYMRIEGHLDAQGTASDHIIFTLVHDDAHGGDTYSDGAPTSLSPREQGVRFDDAASSRIEHAEFWYMDPALDYGDSPIHLSDVTFKENELGVHAGAGATTTKAENITFSGNEATSTIPLR